MGVWEEKRTSVKLMPSVGSSWTEVFKGLPTGRVGGWVGGWVDFTYLCEANPLGG